MTKRKTILLTTLCMMAAGCASTNGHAWRTGAAPLMVNHAPEIPVYASHGAVGEMQTGMAADGAAAATTMEAIATVLQLVRLGLGAYGDVTQIQLNRAQLRMMERNGQ